LLPAGKEARETRSDGKSPIAAIFTRSTRRIEVRAATQPLVPIHQGRAAYSGWAGANPCRAGSFLAQHLAHQGWDIRHGGLGVVLSPELPQLLRQHLKLAVQDFLDASGMSLGEFNGFLFHPGGAKVLETVQRVPDLRRDDLGYSWAVLRYFGNMSSPTILFALNQSLKAAAMAAFGPGFSAYFLTVDL